MGFKGPAHQRLRDAHRAERITEFQKSQAMRVPVDMVASLPSRPRTVIDRTAEAWEIDSQFNDWQLFEAARVAADSDGRDRSWRDWIAWSNQPDRVTRKSAAAGRAARQKLKAEWLDGRFGNGFPVAVDVDELRGWSSHRAHVVRGIIGRAGADLDQAQKEAEHYVQGFGVTPPAVRSAALPSIGKGTRAAAIKKMMCPQWWKRTARMEKLRNREARAIRAGEVCAQKSYAVSDEAIAWRRAGAERNADMIEGMECVRERDGERVEMSKIVAGSLANPRIRAAELGMRAKGLEDVAERRGWSGFVVHLTTPSRFHARLQKTGKRNPKFDGSTPREAQVYLREVWARVRARYAKKGIEVFGLRAAEPHHDGTPHWHMLIFCAPEQSGEAQKIMRAVALEDSPDDYGASQHRARIVPVEASRGSATGYILKYILKGVQGAVTGEAMTPDERGQLTIASFDAATHAERILTWAWVHGIRQFQTFGAPARVAEWREFRRVREPLQMELFEPLRAAADEGRFADFAELMQAGDLRIMRPLPQASNVIAGAPVQSDYQPLTKYGERAAPRVLGVVHESGELMITRLDTWTLERKSDAAKGPEFGTTWTGGINCNPEFSPEISPSLSSFPPVFSLNRRTSPPLTEHLQCLEPSESK